MGLAHVRAFEMPALHTLREVRCMGWESSRALRQGVPSASSLQPVR